ncbi:MAG TPA: hypothetical protein PLN91_05065 [Rhodanobacteraceae bacterium]|nr:hypothetical protein [Rhodanobacteraceae bacterium]
MPTSAHPPRMALVDTGAIPGGGRLRLFRDGPHYVIKLDDGTDLMSTRAHGSEEALAQQAALRLGARPAAQWLVGGLGIGYTLAAALRQVGADARVTVAELVPAVVAWNRDWLGAFAGHPLADARAQLHEGDVAELLRGAGRRWDAILLDVDNGPEGITRAGNDWLYAPAGLRAIRAALRAGGVLAVWSAHSAPAFTRRLAEAGFAVEELPARALGRRGQRHRLWLAQARPA